MHLPYRSIALSLVFMGFFAIVIDRAQAGGGHFFAPASAPETQKECGSCHLVYAPSMLPASSWTRMMADLSNHFGEDASIDANTARIITTNLVAQAADNGGQNFSAKLMRDVSLSQAPLRITELPAWLDKHRKVPDWEWQHKDVQSKSNCTACHSTAAKGYYDE
ncbi:diheme cytochrome c [Rhodoferax sp.]|uniref:diheme cytochrome c n=1 Tax=Rhodoferax sp. TaxID=50421 RepID=UPI0026371251|nr:diheme cytochrome c [Rhodoferax sp.]MDD5478826.1 diheme cytochrome c [Rhodoferax sp.]